MDRAHLDESKTFINKFVSPEIDLDQLLKETASIDASFTTPPKNMTPNFRLPLGYSVSGVKMIDVKGAVLQFKDDT